MKYRTLISALTILLFCFVCSATGQQFEQNDLGMTFVKILPGSFYMGSEDGFPDEKPVHLVRITKAFNMSIHEVTQEQFSNVMGFNPSEFKGAELPVDSVSWEMAVEFCRLLSARDGRTYRLPTEAEWEYAARKGMATVVDDVGGHALANVADESAKGKYPALTIFAGLNDGFIETAPVGSYPPDRSGLHDLSGNVWEWCSDYYSEDYYRYSPGCDPNGPTKGTHHVFRGGSWDDGPRTATITLRGILHDGQPKSTNGFRVIME